ncbi:hypothetical protein BH20ACT22_BH20ACT22_25180 [soil metagenome]
MTLVTRRVLALPKDVISFSRAPVASCVSASEKIVRCTCTGRIRTIPGIQGVISGPAVHIVGMANWIVVILMVRKGVVSIASIGLVGPIEPHENVCTRVAL